MSTIIDASVTVQNDTITTSFTVDGDTVTATLSANPRGPRGYTGADGADGAAGPNLVDTTTATTITGLLKGNGSTVAEALPDADYLTPSTASSSYQPLDSDLTAIAALNTTTFGRSLLTYSGASALSNLLYTFPVTLDADSNVTDGMIDKLVELSGFTLTLQQIGGGGTRQGFILAMGPGAVTSATYGGTLNLSAGQVAVCQWSNAGENILGLAGPGSGLTGLLSANVADSVSSWTSNTDDGKLVKFGEDGTIATEQLNANGVSANTVTATNWYFPDGAQFSYAGTALTNHRAELGLGSLALQSAISSSTETTLTGILKGDGTYVGEAVAGTDYLAPDGDGSGLTGLKVTRVFASQSEQNAATPDFIGQLAIRSDTGALLQSGAGVGEWVNNFTFDGIDIGTNGIVSIGSISGSNIDASGNVTGNAATATALETSRNIFGLSFNGTANVSGDATNTGHFASIPTGGAAGHFITLNGTAPTLIAGRSAWFSDGSGNPSFKNGTGAAVTLVRSSDLGIGVATALAVNVGSAGAFVTFNGAGGTPSSLTLTNATGLPVSTGITGLGTGVATWLATPSSANLAAAVTDETGSGSLVFATSPTISNLTASTSSATVAGLVVSGPTTAVDTLQVKGTSTASYSSIGLLDSTNTQKGSFGYGGSAAASYASTVFFNSASGVPIAFGPGGTEKVRFSAAGGVTIGATTDAGAGNLLISGGAATVAKTSLGTTTVAGYTLSNSTAAAAGAQQVSPAIQWTGQGWKTNATAASQAVDFRAFVLPGQGTANPIGTWTLQSSINGGAWADKMTVDSLGNLTIPSAIFTMSNRWQLRDNGVAGRLLVLGVGATLFLQVGGSTTSFPALKPTGTSGTLRIELADASGTLAPLECSSLNASGGVIYGAFTVATFPTTTYLEGVVTDALAPVVGAAVSAGGSAKCKVMYNGTSKIVTALL